MDWDIEADLWSQAEFPRSEAPPLPSLKVKKGRASLFEADIDEEELIAEMNKRPKAKNIRGRVIDRPSEEVKPGKEAEVKREIRLIGGMGYTNQFIEETLKNNKYDDAAPIDNSMMPNLHFRVSSRNFEKPKVNSSKKNSKVSSDFTENVNRTSSSSSSSRNSSDFEGKSESSSSASSSTIKVYKRNARNTSSGSNKKCDMQKYDKKKVNSNHQTEPVITIKVTDAKTENSLRLLNGPLKKINISDDSDDSVMYFTPKNSSEDES